MTTQASEQNSGLPPAGTNFGHELLPFFFLNKNYTNINHGSYGSPPRYVMNANVNYQVQMDSNTDQFFRYDLNAMMKNLRTKLGKYIHAAPEDIAIVDNASAGVNAVLRSLLFQKGDKIVFFSNAYGMVKQTLNYVHDRFEATLVEIPMKVDIIRSKQKIVDAVKNTIEAEGASSVKLCIFDHISSTPGVVLPLKELIDVCKGYNIMTLVDGAHAVGQIPLNITELDPDFYLSNAHKWLYSPKGSAFLYVSKRAQQSIHPVIISFGYKQGFQQEFEWTGTRDYSPYLSISDALDWRAQLGEENITKYMHDLALWTGEYLANLWNTEVLQTDSTMVGAMINVRLPVSAASQATSLVDKLMKKYNTYLVAYEFDGKIWTRISTQIYNEKSDIEMVGNAVLKELASL